MGLILDSTVVIAAERRGETVVQLLRQIAAVAGDQQVAIASVGLTELVHAIYRAHTPQLRLHRESFINDLLADVEILPYTRSTAMLAGKIDGEQRTAGVTIPSMDLLIGVTALEIDYSIVTLNQRHFRLIPDLNIIQI